MGLKALQQLRRAQRLQQQRHNLPPVALSSFARRWLSSEHPEDQQEPGGMGFALKLFGGLAAATIAGGIGMYAYQATKEGENADAVNAKVEAVGFSRRGQGVDPLTVKLASNQELKPINFQGITEIQTAWLNSNEPMEDRHSTHTLNQHGVLLGMFDGHSGFEASDAASIFLASYVNNALTPLDVDATEDKVEAALKQAFVSFDKDLTETVPNMALESKNPTLVENFVQPAMAGSCACVALVHPTGVYVANTGDCRAVLGMANGSGTTPVILSHDQTGETPSEVERLRKEHPGEPNVVARGRILGGLQPSRAFGDSRYKWDPAKLTEVGIRPPKRSTTPPYVTAEPEVLFHPHQDKNRFLILATDGLWDVVNPDEAVEVVDQAVREGADALSAAGKLVRYALQRYAKFSNVGSVEALLRIQAPESRNYRDDITVMVTFLDSKEQPPVLEEVKEGVPSVVETAQLLTPLSTPPEVTLPQVFEDAKARAGSSTPAA
eukprot:TRINITY_DN10456_c0_g2_i1.p1 TRINITY_DN10456_c0_g2~~TRINITY_DN10456_c0_g2_i1.p1  ORF type:complete len:494 (+),score=133.75 TRINITY_DN10456_c0_g2_i1:51-1532(+)